MLFKKLDFPESDEPNNIIFKLSIPKFLNNYGT